MKQFKTLDGKPIANVIDYIKNYLSTRPNVEILIGADSQSYGSRKTVYGVVIALYNVGKGAHVLCLKESVEMERNLQSRLLTEVWKAVEVAEFLRENGLPDPKWIEIDLNPDPKYKSNSVFRQSIGLVEGMGFRARGKHDGCMSTYAANNLVRS